MHKNNLSIISASIINTCITIAIITNTLFSIIFIHYQTTPTVIINLYQVWWVVIKVTEEVVWSSVLGTVYAFIKLVIQKRVKSQP